MQRFRPAFRGGDDEFAAAVYRMTTLPGRPTLLITVGLTLASLPFGMAEFSFIQTGGLERVPVLFILIIGSIYLGGIGLFYHSLYQLREISRLYRDHVEVRLARVRPLHALSRVTGLTALGLIVLNYGWYIAQPGLDPNNPVTIIESNFLFLLALITFAWPLWGAHRLLGEAKEQGLADVARRREAVRMQLHQAVDGGHLDRVDPLHKVLGALEAENTELARVATWPWAPGTLRGLLGAVFLPVVLWLIQFGLGRLLG